MRRALAALVGLAALALSGAQEAPSGVRLDVVVAESPAARLSDYGLFQDAGARSPSPRVTPYELTTPLFSDYAVKHRYIFTPDGKSAAYQADGPLEFPVGSVLVKTFAFAPDLRQPTVGERYVETRLLIRKADGWTALAYVWNADQTEAVLKRTGGRLDVSFIDPSGVPQAISYLVPNQNQCKTCHSADGELVPIGPKARNLNRDLDYGDRTQNQLAAWRRLGHLSGGPHPAEAPRMAAWDDMSEPLEARARAYLDVNCAHCHSPAGMASTSGLYLGVDERRPVHLGVGKSPVAAGRGSGGLAVSIAPGRPDRSIMVYRMASTDPGIMMPELGRALPHKEGTTLVADYIASLQPAASP
ncbi:MAG: SO2930 family diheme c-type cytochrome [Phenylobacterium sp.]|uniref:SO2930 family diheme c-type cytochrome n=1 Tax=Phenylobacterium sp. TaxID=1871053 RepID=UPI0027281B9E|nr:SO2930 family diheme c-type cytochrome [Phenylobacterium sp.]MDO8900766.1 SO2930 family diheme c-type cytochrome [Phenylobacterium sp.]